MDGRMLITVAGVVFVLVAVKQAAGTAARRRCEDRVFRKVQKCDEHWGFNLAVFQQNKPGYVLDLNQLIQYCRNPDRPDIYRCVRDAHDKCDPNWQIDLTNRIQQPGKLGTRAFDYLCNNVDVLNKHQGCIQSQMWPISACFRTAAEDFVDLIEENTGSRGQGRKWAQQRSNIRQMGERIERCVYKAVSDACTEPVTKVFGNFLYGILVYPYLDL